MKKIGAITQFRLYYEVDNKHSHSIRTLVQFMISSLAWIVLSETRPGKVTYAYICEKLVLAKSVGNKGLLHFKHYFFVKVRGGLLLSTCYA
jgi:hypothetical protein